MRRKERWQIEVLFKQIKQNFPLHFFNLLLTIIQRQIKHPWIFSGFATMLRILLMHYVSLAFLEGPESGWADVLAQYAKSPPKLEAIQTQLF